MSIKQCRSELAVNHVSAGTGDRLPQAAVGGAAATAAATVAPKGKAPDRAALRERVAYLRVNLAAAVAMWPLTRRGSSKHKRCSCPPRVVGGSQLSCTGANGVLCKKLQKDLNTVLSKPGLRAYFVGTRLPDPAWKGEDTAKQQIRDDIEAVLNHRFRLRGRDGKLKCLATCEAVRAADGTTTDCAALAVQSGRHVTCPAQQSEIRGILKAKILDKLDELVIPTFGVATQNGCETNGAIAAWYRRKGTALSALR